MFASTGIFAASDLTLYGGSNILTIVSVVLGLALLAANIFVAVDAGKRQDWAHQQAGSNKVLWIVGGILGGILGLCCCFILGLPAPIAWFAAFRNKVEAAEKGGPGQSFGGPPGGFGGPPPGGPPPGGPPPGGFPPPPGGTPPPPPGGFGQQ